jgi:hypothetical protein
MGGVGEGALFVEQYFPLTNLPHQGGGYVKTSPRLRASRFYFISRIAFPNRSIPISIVFSSTHEKFNRNVFTRVLFT